MSNNQFYSLKVKDILAETAESKSFIFEIPDKVKETFKYKSGQYITIKVVIDGEEYRRSYSMSSAPFEDYFGVTVKRVEGGKVSPFLHDSIQKSDVIEVIPPEGRFIIVPEHLSRKDYYFFAAGSGITPVYSIIKNILENEPQSTVYLLYGNRMQSSIIFEKGLDQLSTRYKGQLYVKHTLSKVSNKGSLKGFFRKKSAAQWNGWAGRIDSKSLKRFMEEFPPGKRDCEYFICGPFDMIESAIAFLKDRKIDKKQIHREYFKVEKDETSFTASGKSELIFHLDGDQHKIDINKKDLILETLIKHNFDPPYSCASGTCSTCTAKVISGKVKMEVCYALDDDEVEEGFILTCQSRLDSPVVEISYDV